MTAEVEVTAVNLDEIKLYLSKQGLNKYLNQTQFNKVCKYIGGISQHTIEELIQVASKAITVFGGQDIQDPKMVTPLHLLFGTYYHSEFDELFHPKMKKLYTVLTKEALNDLFDFMKPHGVTGEISVENFCKMWKIIERTRLNVGDFVYDKLKYGCLYINICFK